MADFYTEKNQALQAGERAKISLQNALNCLNGARGWGIVDILGGGLISTFLKHSKMNKASEFINQAKLDLQTFARELNDLHMFDNIDINTGDFWGFADWFFDGFLSDFLIQQRINEARSQVQQAIYRVDNILNDVRRQEDFGWHK